MAHVYHSVPRYTGHLGTQFQNPLLASFSSHCCTDQQREGFERLCTGTVASALCFVGLTSYLGTV